MLSAIHIIIYIVTSAIARAAAHLHHLCRQIDHPATPQNGKICRLTKIANFGQLSDLLPKTRFSASSRPATLTPQAPIGTITRHCLAPHFPTLGFTKKITKNHP